jgi:hypothetical protein
MKKNLFELMKNVGWSFYDYDEFLDWLTTTEDLIDKYWGFIEDGFDANKFKYSQELNESLGFVIDLLKILNNEEE